MDRRHFLKNIGAASLFASLPSSFKLHAAPTDYTGKLLITVQAVGGWDVTSFCDPKMNTAGEREINRWARAGETQTAGNIAYAPFANNAAFFQKYYQDIMVINGIDSQTNSHSAGETHNWSGKISEGHPSLTALFAGVHAPDFPITYINNGGYANTGNLVRYTRLDQTDELLNVIYPNQNRWDANTNWLHNDDWQRITAARNARLAELNAATNQTARQTLNRSNYQSALSNSASLTDFANSLNNAGEIQGSVSNGNFFSTFRRQAQIALIAMSSGVTVSADLIHWGFDTHDNHDADHTWLISELTGGLDYLWTYAEQLGIADRLVVLVGSDFGRTPHYNSTEGKDHWPITSMMVMERGAPWGNRSVGTTDAIHNAVAINPQTLLPDSSGTLIYPKDVMQSMREYLGLANSAGAQAFSLGATSGFNFFAT